MRGLLQRWTISSTIPSFKRRISLEEQKVHLIYEHFPVSGTHDSVKNNTDLFTVLRNDDVQEFDSKWNFIVHDENTT